MLLIAAAFVAALVAGCGSGSSDAAESKHGYQVQASTTMATASPPISRARFVSYINGVCHKAWTTIVHNFAIQSRTEDPKLSKKDRVAEAIKLSLFPGLDFHIFDDIHMLGSPKGQEDEIEAIIGPFQAAVELGELGRGAKTLAEVPGDFATFNQRARRYGLGECLVDQAHVSRIDA